MSRFIEEDWKDGDVFIQYKGTDICLDFTCTCGEHGHFDGYFAYVLKCKCGLLWEMPCFITPRLSQRNEDLDGVVELQ